VTVVLFQAELMKT